MNDTIELAFRYSESDIVSAVRAHYRARLRVKLDFVLLIVVAAFGADLWRSPNMHWWGLFFLGVSAAFAILLFAALMVLPHTAFRFQPRFKDDYSLVFSSEGVHFRTAHIDSQLRWSLYSRALVDADSYLLYYGARSFTIVPKRVFHDRDQQTAFEQLIGKHISRIEHKK
ncbi:MAG TPA: YcxB family protein [Candidatus Sulfotelmatobacter sp.]|nr:YcxB family protein [Candidatus Sulfotelmatobacter sp.]